MKECGLIVRQGDDFGQELKSVTPGPESIMQNIDRFLDKWNSIKYKDWFILTNGFQQEISNLKVQIMKGCLSYTALGMGTNRNERIHESLKSSVGINKISVEAANAIFSLLFCNQNTKKKGYDYVCQYGQCMQIFEMKSVMISNQLKTLKSKVYQWN